MNRGRYFHTAWTPPRPFNSIALFGGTDGSGYNEAAELTAEVVQPGGGQNYLRKLSFLPSILKFSLMLQNFVTITDRLGALNDLLDV